MSRLSVYFAVYSADPRLASCELVGGSEVVGVRRALGGDGKKLVEFKSAFSF